MRGGPSRDVAAAGAAASRGRQGSQTEKIEPWPTLLSTATSPPCKLDQALGQRQAEAGPLGADAARLGELLELAEQAAAGSSRAMPTPVSATSMATRLVRRVRASGAPFRRAA